MTEGPHEGVLYQFLSIQHIRHLPDNHGEDALCIATDHFRLSLAPPFADGCHDFCLRRCAHLYLLYDKFMEISRTSLNFFHKTG
jgi:hypothetical protein